MRSFGKLPGQPTTHYVPDPPSPERLVRYDSLYGLATLQGPGGFTQIAMAERSARAVAIALGISWRLERTDRA